MRKILTAATLVILSAGAALADPIEGMWKTQPEDGSYVHVKIAPCGPAFCGVITNAFKDNAEYKSPNLGKTLVIDMTPRGGGKYEGKVWNPKNGKIYTGKVGLSDKTMKLSGCVAGGLICSKQTWSQLK